MTRIWSSANPRPVPREVIERRRVSGWTVVGAGCWKLPNKPNPQGYVGLDCGRAGNFPAHRVSYEQHVGPIPRGLQLDHLCRNRWCVNPAHLEPVTNAENVRRGENHLRILKTHCVNGHAFTEENTRIDSLGKRVCRACVRAIWHRREARRKARAEIASWPAAEKEEKA